MGLKVLLLSSSDQKSNGKKEKKNLNLRVNGLPSVRRLLYRRCLIKFEERGKWELNVDCFLLLQKIKNKKDSIYIRSELDSNLGSIYFNP